MSKLLKCGENSTNLKIDQLQSSKEWISNRVCVLSFTISMSVFSSIKILKMNMSQELTQISRFFWRGDLFGHKHGVLK